MSLYISLYQLAKSQLFQSSRKRKIVGEHKGYKKNKIIFDSDDDSDNVDNYEYSLNN